MFCVLMKGVKHGFFIVSSYSMEAHLVEISKFFETQYPLNKEGLHELLHLFQLKLYAKGDVILKSDTEENQLRFLNQGIIREYYATAAKETNINFYTKPQFITDLTAFNNDTKTKKYQECLSKVALLSVSKSDFRIVLTKYQCGQSFIEMSFQKLLKHKEVLEYNRITKSPEDLYQELLMSQSDWLALIPQYHIASYLNITPETLSRIRKRIS